MPSSEFRDGPFRLRVANPVEGGAYTCLLPPAALLGDAVNASVDVDAVEARLTLLEADNRRLKGSNSRLQGQVTGLEGEVTGLKGEVTKLQGNNSRLQGQVTGLEGQVTDLLGENEDLRKTMTLQDNVTSQAIVALETDVWQHLSTFQRFMNGQFLGEAVVLLVANA